MTTIKIYFKDLNKEAQKRFLDDLGYTDASDTNYDIMPIAIIEFDDY